MSTTHPQVDAYLDDLARMLADIDPGERDDILASVREHLDVEIGSRGGGDAVVHAALLRLGPPEQVAAEARSGGTGTAASAASPSGGPDQLGPHRAGGYVWARVAVVTTLLATLPFLLLTLVSRTWTSGRGSTGAGWPEEVGLFGTHPAEVAMLMVLASPLWLVALVCTLVAPGLRRGTRVRLALAGPAAFLATIIGSASWAPHIVSGVVSVILLAGVAFLVITSARAAWRETTGGPTARGQEMR
jgi:HAAS domain-containing protein